MFARLNALIPQRLKDIIDLRLDFLFRHDTDWHYHDHLFEVTLIDGTKASGGLMRRKIGSGCSAGNTDMVSQPAFSRDSR